LLLGLVDRLRAPAPDPARVGWLAGQDYAHRGLHGPGTPENSISAFAEAISRGMGIECDVQKSADERPMVFHDWELDRLTAEKGPVAGCSSTDLAQIQLTGSNDRIPQLKDLLGLIRGRVPLLIEVKSKRDRRPAPLCLAVRRALEGYHGPHAVMSFDPRVAHWFRTHSPHTVRGLVVTEENARTFAGTLLRHGYLWHAKPDFLAYDVRDFPSRFAAAQRKRGLPLLTWTVRSPQLREIAGEYADAPIAEGAGVATIRE
jgi:glycerophosphoryl diester phosphodiesterase